MNSRLFVVLGMHRSGTSVITRGLQVLGVELGDQLMSGILGINPKGFMENIDLYRLDEEILQELSKEWNHVSPISFDDIKLLHKGGFFSKAVDLLHKNVDSLPMFGFKDPRIPRLLPFWKEIFNRCDFSVSYILVVRNPLSVVKSLLKRDGLDETISYLLWLGHIIPSLSGTVETSRILVDYDRLMNDPDYELNRIAERFDLEIDLEELHSYKSEFLEEGLRHTNYELKDMDDKCPPLVREIYATLLDVASDKVRLDDFELHKSVEKWEKEFDRLASLLSLTDKLTGRVTTLNQAVAELNQAVAERDIQIASLQRSIELMLDSLGWRLTSPLRYLSSAIRKLSGVFTG